MSHAFMPLNPALEDPYEFEASQGGYRETLSRLPPTLCFLVSLVTANESADILIIVCRETLSRTLLQKK